MTLARSFRLGLLSLGALLFLAPYIFMLSTAAKSQQDIFSSSLSLIPHNWALWDNLAKAMSRVPMGLLLFNGVVVCALVLVIQATALPFYVGFNQLGVLNSYFALSAPFFISVFGIFLFLQFFRAMPDDLISAARLDGMSEAGIVMRVIVPNAWPAITAFSIFSVVAHWNDLFWPLIVVNGMERATPPLGLLYFRAAEAGDDYGALMAATLIITLPLLLAFLAAQRRFIEGITLTGLKG